MLTRRLLARIVKKAGRQITFCVGAGTGTRGLCVGIICGRVIKETGRQVGLGVYMCEQHRQCHSECLTHRSSQLVTGSATVSAWHSARHRQCHSECLTHRSWPRAYHAYTAKFLPTWCVIQADTYSVARGTALQKKRANEPEPASFAAAGVVIRHRFTRSSTPFSIHNAWCLLLERQG